MIDPTDNDMWLDAINGKYHGGVPFSKTEWDMLLGHCQVSFSYDNPSISRIRLTHLLIGCLRLSRLRICRRAYQSISRCKGDPHESQPRLLVHIMHWNYSAIDDLTLAIRYGLLRYRGHGKMDTNDKSIV